MEENPYKPPSSLSCASDRSAVVRAIGIGLLLLFMLAVGIVLGWIILLAGLLLVLS